jgi:hypothetical protein
MLAEPVGSLERISDFKRNITGEVVSLESSPNSRKNVSRSSGVTLPAGRVIDLTGFLNKKVDSRGSPDLVDSRSTKSGMRGVAVNNFPEIWLICSHMNPNIVKSNTSRKILKSAIYNRGLMIRRLNHEILYIFRIFEVFLPDNMK